YWPALGSVARRHRRSSFASLAVSLAMPMSTAMFKCRYTSGAMFKCPLYEHRDAHRCNGLARGEDGLRNHHVDPDRAIDELRDVDIACDTHELVGLFARHAFDLNEELDRLAHRDLRCLRE